MMMFKESHTDLDLYLENSHAGRIELDVTHFQAAVVRKVADKGFHALTDREKSYFYHLTENLAELV